MILVGLLIKIWATTNYIVNKVKASERRLLYLNLSMGSNLIFLWKKMKFLFKIRPLSHF